MIIIKISDGLGNQLFQYTYALYLKKKGKDVYIDASDINNFKEDKIWTKLCDNRTYQLEHYNITISQTKKVKKFFEWEERYKENIFYRYMNLLQISPYQFIDEKQLLHSKFRYHFYQNYYVKGYFFDKRYYEDVLQDIRTEIRLKESYHMPNDIKEIFNDYDTVSVHFRRGDFLNIGRDMSASNYYEKAIEYIKCNVVNPYFIVFSDDTEWVKDNVELGDNVLFASDLYLRDYEELILMSKCKNNIIANSTYSFWGALLNQEKNKIVIAPKNWRDKLKPKEWINL